MSLLMLWMLPLVPHMEFWSVDLNSIPYMGKVILTNVPLKGGTVNSNVYGLFDGSGKAMPIPAHYAEVIHSGEVTNGSMMAIYG